MRCSAAEARMGAGATEPSAMRAHLTRPRESSCRQFAHDFPRAVGAVRRHDNLVAQAAAIEVAHSFADGYLNDAGLVVSRQNQADLRSHFREASLRSEEH